MKKLGFVKLRLKDLFNLITGSYGADLDYPKNILTWDGKEDIEVFINRRIECGYKKGQLLDNIEKKKIDRSFKKMIKE